MAWLLLLAPLAAAVVIALAALPYRRASIALSVGAAAVAFLVALGLFAGKVAVPAPVPWIGFPELRVDLGFTADPLAKLMLLVVTGVGLLIHVFSVGYMAGDPGVSRFFAKLSLFLFSMLGIVVSTNFIQMFVFWELVGVSSYLLIGFWYERPAAAEAAKKAFFVNRIGDFGFMIGIVWYWAITGTLSFDPAAAERLAGVAPLAGHFGWQHGANFFAGATVYPLPFLALFLFCGAVGKSAQLPLHVWLPDAMEGPTPVSALIHAATMVAAGVYMLARVFFVFEAAPDALAVVAWVGGLTALFAALCATQQDDIKRILAYSTLSQLGYMVLAVGCGGWPAAMFHLTTHAFFKALLFLGAGAVIHGLHHEQDIWAMGGLRRRMPVTFWTFLVGTLALSGVPFLSGFFSKEAILSVVWQTHPALFWIAAATAGLTAFYMMRLLFVAFLGEPRSDAARHAHEAPRVMTVPLLVLAVPAALAGYALFGIVHYLAPYEGAADLPVVSIVSLLVVAAGLTAGWRLYSKPGLLAEPHRIPLLQHKFRIDELYGRTLVAGQDALAKAADAFDRWVVGFGLVRGTGLAASLGGEALRILQTGNVRGYAFVFALGTALLLYFIFF